MVLRIENESELLSAIKDVRHDGSETTWVLATHVDLNPEVIRLAGSGVGGVDNLAAYFDENSVSYGLLRVTQKIDLSTTTKFVYFYFIGEAVPALQRGKIGTAHGEIRKLFHPYHIDFELSNANDITAEIVDAKVNETSGKVDKVREVNYDGSAHERGFTSTSSVKSSGTQKRSNFGFQGQSEGAGDAYPADASILEAILDVRSDKSETNWLLVAYQDNDTKKPLQLVGTGNGGVDELTSHLTSELIAYAFFRIVDVLEGIKTVKFAFITYIGPDVSVMKKAKVSTNKGGVIARFSPFHVTLEISSPHELSDEILLTLVQEASGSKSKVK